jgi:hypothetical protein
MERPDIGSGGTAFACVRVQLKTPAKKKLHHIRPDVGSGFF